MAQVVMSGRLRRAHGYLSGVLFSLCLFFCVLVVHIVTWPKNSNPLACSARARKRDGLTSAISHEFC